MAHAAGMNKITGDMAAMAAQIPALFETLVGHEDVRSVSKVKQIGRPVAETTPAASENGFRKEKIMALLERVSTLVRANLNDLIDKAEDPEKMIKQVILDMQNQLLQVKTQVAIAIADQHCWRRSTRKTKRRRRNGCAKRRWPWTRSRTTWRGVALERSVTANMGESFRHRWPIRRRRWRT